MYQFLKEMFFLIFFNYYKFVKVKSVKMANMATKVKMAGFLLLFSNYTSDLFCLSGHDTPGLRFL